MESSDALMEEKKLMNEPKYRNYMSNIDKALRNFEYSSEWADLISALGKLNKAISSNTQYLIIPRRIKISKRLAQCMHPALPSGVHLKALETYDVIFSKTGPERLATELFIYSAGLFPLLGYAAMNVRPALLAIYEKYFVPLGEKLRPALSGFLSGVLPGYESGLDHFERTNSLLTQVCAAVGPMYFYSVLWECVTTNASIRLPAISYLLDHFNKRLGMREQIYIMGYNHDIMMSGLCACLNDTVILVQRNTLEFLLLGFPMHTNYLNKDDIIKLVTNGLTTILRRDMSLNRRLYSWLLGTEVTKMPEYREEDGISYFDKHSKNILIKAMTYILQYSLESTPVDLKPYRILVSLLDKAEIGLAILDYVLCDVIRTMYLSGGNVEVGKSANLLFATFDPAYIWNFITIIYEKNCRIVNNVTKAEKISSKLSKNLHNNNNSSSQLSDSKVKCVVGSGDPSLIEVCYLTEFLLETISLEMYNETTRVYLPKMFLAITRMLTMHSDHLTHDEVTASLKLCMKIVSRVQPMITSPVKVLSNDKRNSLNNKDEQNNKSFTVSDVCNALEKSKSDSKLNQSSFDDEPMRRSNSNYNINKRSPKKAKKAKSYSKLLIESDKELIPDTGHSNILDSLSEKESCNPKKMKNDKKISSHKKLTSSSMDINEDDGYDNGRKAVTAVSLDDILTQSKKLNSLLINGQHKPDATAVITEESTTFTTTEFPSLETAVLQKNSILEKCIKQYEIFYEVYLSRQILDISTCHQHQEKYNGTAKCQITVRVNEVQSKSFAENIFDNNEIYNGGSEERSIEINKLFETLQINSINRTKHLQNLLNKSLILGTDSTSDLSDVEFKDCLSSSEKLDISSEPTTATSIKLRNFEEGTEKTINRIMSMKLSEPQKNSIKLASNLLVEMSTFPNYNKNMIIDHQELDLSSWLKVLVIVACYTQNDKELQLSAITTLFDLVSLLRSQIQHTTSPGVTFVVMLPLLRFGHVKYLENKTRVFHLLVSILWDYLGDSTTDQSQISSLLYQLHNCLESGLVENVIGNRMSNAHTQFIDDELLKNFNKNKLIDNNSMNLLTSYKLDRLAEIRMMCVPPSQIDCDKYLYENESQSFRKFELLWHLGREKQPVKSFERTLLRVFDVLALPYNISIRTFVTKWLQESLLRGDLSRLIKPLNKMFLASNTKRIGIVHIHLIRKNGEGSDTTLSRDIEDDADTVIDREVYAISSEYGNVKYHMDASHKQKRSPIRSLQKKFFGVTLGNKNKMSNFVSDKGTTLSLTENENNIGLIINPLDLSSDIDVNESEVGSIGSIAQNKPEGSVGGGSISIGSIKEVTIDKDERYSSAPPLSEFYSTSEDSDDSYTETESEQRETSAEKENIAPSLGTGGVLKRFAGDCEHVSEALSEHDRVKNRKTYHLKQNNNNQQIQHEKSNVSSIEISNEQQLNHLLEESHAAEEYFSSSSGTDAVENFINSLFDQVSATECDTKFSKEKKSRTSLKTNSKTKTKSKKRISGGDKKHANCHLKTSSESNKSLNTFKRALNENEIPSDINDDWNSENDENEVSEENGGSIKEQIIDEGNLSSQENNEALKKRSSSLVMGNKINWELDKKTLEKSKQNVEILRQTVASDVQGKKSFKRKVFEGRKRYFDRLHPYHTHMLLYFDVYDTKQTLYAFQTLRNIILSDTRTFLCLSITTSIPNGSLKNLLIRHRKSVFGKGFSGNITNTEFSQQYRGCMYLEALVQICLYFGRSYFQNEKSNEKNERPSFDDICGNCKVQLASIELLTLICSELIEIVKGMGKGLACYIADLMTKCKMQKIILHCINSSVLSFNTVITKDSTLSEQILAFNYPLDDNLHAESFQIQLLRLLMAVIKLEYEVTVLKNDEKASATKDDSNSNLSSNSPTRLTNAASINVKYLPNCLISQQPMFLASVLSALQADHLRHLHRNWTDLVTSSLSCFNFGSLTNIVISVIHQLCNNIDKIAKLTLKEQCNFPPDYVVSQLEAITILCHYCLLDNTQQTTLSHLFNQAYPQTSASVQSSNTGQLLNNIVHSFLSTQNSSENQSRNAQHLAARNAVLSHLSKIVASVAAIWDSELGEVRQVKQQLMEFLSPISLHHGVNFLAAVAVTWQERGEMFKKEQESKLEARKASCSEYYVKNAIPQASPEQQSLVKLVSSIRVMPMDSFVQTLHQVVKSPPPIHRPPVGLTIEVSALELFYFYMKGAPAPQIGDSWSSLLALLRDGISLSPPAQFVLLMLLNEFVQKYPQLPFPDKKDLRDLHDVTSRLVEALSGVAGACLEQTTWLRRNLAVKEDITPTTPDGSIKDLTGNQQYCVQAQTVLAFALANLLDVAYGSQEKDKVVTILTTLLYNITPYLKNHTIRNIPSFFACSHLLANLSGYQYTRKAWRKDMFDLFLDASFFQMDISCLPFWKQILDNLMTYDSTTFRELMSRVSLAQTSSLSIFSSREQEYEQRAVLLKRLAFVIFCSELDQYHKYMPEIQEQLVNSLRLPSVVPSIQAAVFLCFRVLLLRMSPDHVTSLWPIIIAEMVQVFIAMEQELKSDSDELSQQIRVLSGLDVSWAITSGNGLSSQNHLTHWRNVQLEAAKLLELGCVLPATLLPHFQMYRWAFVGTEFDAPEEKILTNGHLDDLQLFLGSGYIPHVRRIARLMDLKYAVHSPKIELKKGDHLVLTCQQISSLQDLYGFFSTLSVTCSTPRNFSDTDKTIKSCLAEVEDVLATDFLEKMSTTTTPR